MFRTLLFTLVASMFLLSNAQAADKLIVASDACWPPMEYLDGQKNVMGYSTDYIKELVKETGLQMEVRNIAWDGIFAGLIAGQYDIVASSVTITPERQKQMGFTIPYYQVRQAIVVKKGAACTSLADLKGKKVGGQIGTTGIFVVQAAKCNAIIREYEDVGLAMEDLSNGRIDAVVCDDPVAGYYANKKEGFANKFQVAFKTGETEDYGFAVQKGRTDIIEKLNKGILSLRAKGVEKALIAKWMGE